MNETSVQRTIHDYLTDIHVTHSTRFEFAKTDPSTVTDFIGCYLDAEHLRSKGYLGGIISFLHGNAEVKRAKTSWTLKSKRPRFIAGDLYANFSSLDWADQVERNVAIWFFKGSVPFSATIRVLEAVYENGRETISENSEGTLFMFTYVAAPGRRLRQHLGEEASASLTDLEDQETIVELALSKLRNRGIEPLPFSSDETRRWEALLSAPEALQCRVSDNVLTAMFCHQESECWSPDEASSLMGCIAVKLRRTGGFEQIILDTEPAPLPSFPSELVEGQCKISYGNNVFTDDPEQCILDDDSTYLLPLESVQRFPELKPYAALIHYIFYRLQTRNTTIHHTGEWPEIRFPFASFRKFAAKQTARVLCHKPEQSMKTILSVAIAWVYCFIRGFNVAMILRNVGARHTGLVGLSTKGVGGFNDIISELLDDIENQLQRNGWDRATALNLLTLKVKTDQGVKWGANSSLKGTRRDDVRREIQLDEQATELASKPGILLAFPMNAQSLEFFTDMMIKIDNIHRTMVCIDEADEPIASVDRDETKIEKAMYPQKAGPGGFPLNVLGDGEDNEDTIADDEEWRGLVDLFKHKRMKSVPHVIMVTATILPILFTSQDTSFFVMEMLVSPNYIGIATPDYCISRVEVSSEAVPEAVPGTRHILTSDTWWHCETNVLREIYRHWENIIHFQAVLITTAGTTNMIAKQVVGAQAIVKHATFAMTAVVNNGSFSCIYFSRHFDTLTNEHIRRRLIDRLMGSTLQLGEGVIVPQLESSEGGTKMLVVPNSFKIVDRNTKEQYKRQHPSTLIEIVLASFEEAGLASPRCAFLETEMICGREKSYVSFSRRETLTDLYYNFPAGRNATTTSQVWGRVCGVFVPMDPVLRKRRIWTREAVKEEQLLHKRIIRFVLDLLSQFPGSTMDEINAKVHSQNSGIGEVHLTLWNNAVNVLRGAFKMSTSEPHHPSTVPLNITKNKHQVQTRRIVSEFREAKRSRVEQPTITQTSIASERDNGSTSTLEHIIDTAVEKARGASLYLPVDQGRFGWDWWIDQIETGYRERTSLQTHEALHVEAWYHVIQPWYQFLINKNHDRPKHIGVLVAIMYNHFPEGIGSEQLEAILALMCNDPPSIQSLREPLTEYGGNRPCLTIFTKKSPKFILNPQWKSIVFGTEAKAIYDLGCHDELLDAICVLASEAFEQIQTALKNREQASLVGGIKIPSLDYRRKFDADLQAAALLTDDERRTMPLLLEKTTGTRKHWRIVCELFTRNGEVVRRSEHIDGNFFKRWKMSRSNFDRAVCKYRIDKSWNPWRPYAKGTHLIANSDKTYSLAW